MDMIRILHIVNRMGRGGMESRIMDLYRHIDRKRFQYDFYIESGKKGVFDDEVIELGGKVFYRKNIQKYNLPSFKEFNKFLDTHCEYKIVYAYNQWAGYYLKCCEDRGVPVRIANARTSLDKTTLTNIVKSVVKENVNKYATHRFAVSKNAANWLYGHKELKNGNVKIWPNAIDTEKYAFSKTTRDQVREKLGITDELVVMRVANIRQGKNYQFSIKVFAEIKRLHDHTKMLLVGAGDYGPLYRLARELNVDQSIICLGEREDIHELLQAGDICLNTSLYEGFPGSVLEAEASGQWCFISDTITDEVALTNHIMLIPLAFGAKKWAQIIINNYSEVDRKYAYKSIANAGFDINQLSENMMLFYMSLQDYVN